MEGNIKDSEGRNMSLPEIIRMSRRHGVTDAVRNAMMIGIQNNNAIQPSDRPKQYKIELIKLINESKANDESTADPEVGQDQSTGSKKKKSKKSKKSKAKKSKAKKSKKSKKSKKKSKRKTR
jgi:hypothetical protein